MHKCHEVEAALDRKMEPDLLVAAVALINGIEQHMKRKRQCVRLACCLAALKGRILRRVVDDQDFDIICVSQAMRYSFENTFDRFLRVVRDDENENALLSVSLDMIIDLLPN